MPRFSQGHYKPINVGKYIGNTLPRYLSSWELRVMQYLDKHPYVIHWSSEPVRIPYFNPETGKNTVYVPDFFVMWYQGNKKKSSLIEIKPRKQAYLEEAKSARSKSLLRVNYAKWVAALSWAQKNGMEFKVLTEFELFHQGKVK